MMPWMGSRKASFEAEIARLGRLWDECVFVPALGRDEWTLRENAREVENAREGRQAIAQSIGGCRQQIRFLRTELAREK